MPLEALSVSLLSWQHGHYSVNSERMASRRQKFNRLFGGSFSISTIVTTVFIILKLAGEIDWPWLWVFSPIWLPYVVGIALITLAGGIWILWGVIGLILDRMLGRK